MALEYRRLEGETNWHWCTHCPHWPTGRFECVHEQPTGPFCLDCRKLDSASQCAPIEEPQPRPLGR